MRYRIDMSYCGAGFCGWQIQPGARTVQGELEKALSTLLRAPIQVVGAGRTDTGVNASRYVAHFDLVTPVPAAFARQSLPVSVPEARSSTESDLPALDTGQLRYKLNAFLPDGIAIQSISPAAPDFHARFDARLREYTYYLNRTKNPFASSWSYYCAYPSLDFDAMNVAASYLLGTHDFSCFEKTGGANKTSICTISEAAWHPLPSGIIASAPALAAASPAPVVSSPACTPGDLSGCSGDLYFFRIAGDRFLRNMVRAIVGTLLEVGRGKRTPEQFRDLIGSGTRCDAGDSVPGHALFLSRIDY